MIHPFLWLVTALLASPLAAQTAAPAEVWTGTLNAGGAELRLEVHLTRDDEGGASGELISLDQGNAKLKLSGVVLSDEELIFDVDSIGASFEGELSEDGLRAEGTFRQGGVELLLTLTRSDAQPPGSEAAVPTTLREAWIGAVEFGPLESILQFRILEAESGETTAFFDSISEGRTGLPAAWAIEDGTLVFTVPSVGATYRGELDPTGALAKGRFSQGGRSFELTLERKAAAYGNTWDQRPQKPRPPFPYTAEEVRFENRAAGVVLAGTLTVPEGPGKHPAVILISGSGPQDRDETFMEHKPFLVLADYLSRRGIAVLRYDDRGTASSTGNFGTATSEDFAADASAAVDFLLEHGRIDGERIGLIGHSEGALVAPIVAASREDLALVVLLAGPGVTGETIAVSQTEAMGRAEGAGPDTIRVSLRIQRAVIDAVKGLQPGGDVRVEIERAIAEAVESMPDQDRERATASLEVFSALLPTLTSPWYRFFLLHDPAPVLSAVTCPVLAINGEKDVQVLADLNLTAIERALRAGGNQDFEVAELPGLNHLFQSCETGAMREYISIQETIDPAALEKIGDWIAQRVGAGR